MRDADPEVEEFEVVCDVTKTSHCHLQGVRYVPRKCTGICELTPEE